LIWKAQSSQILQILVLPLAVNTFHTYNKII
jgi:hypothetical protein